jgi:hypothetical protein
VVFQERDNALIVGTYARGIYVLDDVSPLEKLTTAAIARDAQFVSATRGRQWNSFSLGPTYGANEFYAPNPEMNPVISYHVRDGAAGSAATITISDARGEPFGTLSGPAARGLNSVTWDMRMDPAVTARRGGGRGGRGGGGAGADVAAEPDRTRTSCDAGSYRVTISVPGVSTALRGDVTVQADPMDRAFTANGAASAARRADEPLRFAESVSVRLAEECSHERTTADAVKQQSARVQAELDRIVGVAGSLLRSIESFNSVPTADHRQQMTWANGDAQRALAAIEALRNAP